MTVRTLASKARLFSKVVSFCLFISVCFLLAVPASAANWSCSTFQLQTLPGTSGTQTIVGLNNAGTIIGNDRDANGNTQGYMRDSSNTVTTVAYPGATQTILGGINNKGDIIGTYIVNGDVFPFIRHADGSFVTVPQLNGDPEVQGGGLNDSGDVSLFDGLTTQIVAQDASGNILFSGSPDGFNQGGVVGPINNNLQVLFYNSLFGGSGILTSSGSQSTGFPAFLSFVEGLNNNATTAGFFTQNNSAHLGAISFTHDLNSAAYPTFVCPGFETDGVTVNLTRVSAINDSGLVAGTIAPSAQPTLGFIASTVADAPVISVSNNHWSFQPVAVGASSSIATIYINNTGTGTLRIPNLAQLPLAGPDGSPQVSDDPKDFKVDHTTCTTPIAAGGWCKIAVVFQPSSVGKKQATLVLADNSSTGPQLIALTGTAVSKSIAYSTNSVSFAARAVGSQSSDAVVYAYANGGSSVNFASISIIGADPNDFIITSNSCGTEVAAYHTCSVHVAFKPAATGHRSGYLAFSDDAHTSPVQISLSGTGK